MTRHSGTLVVRARGETSGRGDTAVGRQDRGHRGSHRRSYLLNVASSDRDSTLARTLAPRVGAVVSSPRARGHPRATPKSIFRDVNCRPTPTGLISIARASHVAPVFCDIYFNVYINSLPLIQFNSSLFFPPSLSRSIARTPALPLSVGSSVFAFSDSDDNHKSLDKSATKITVSRG